MKIRSLTIENFRLFPAGRIFIVDSINTPDGTSYGSGLTVFVGENGCGKSSILDAFALPLLSYKADLFGVSDFNDPKKRAIIKLFSDSDFEVKGTMPKSVFRSKGFQFEAGVRSVGKKTYLSSIVVSDQKYLKADGESKPKDGSPDLRVSVNNPFSGSRFEENDVLFLDKNRTYQLRTGAFNQTRFDRLMEDFDYQYLKKHTPNNDINSNLSTLTRGAESAFLDTAIDKFKEVSGKKIELNFINNYRPFEGCFFAELAGNDMQIAVERLGSGYEAIFSILYSYYLATHGKKQLIVLLDEPELHLHPNLQGKFVELLLEFSKDAQIILTTHSSLLVKQLMTNERVNINIIRCTTGSVEVVPIEERLLPYLSANEVNYLAFDLSSAEHHNELYEELKHLNGSGLSYREFDANYFLGQKGEARNSPWKGSANEVSVHTFIRNQIHHPKENGTPDEMKILSSIRKLREFLRQHRSID